MQAQVAVVGAHPRFVLGLVTIAPALLLTQAKAQDNYHWARHHAAPPLSEILPESLPAPPSPVETGKQERPKTDLVEQDDGSYAHDATGFTARVAADGRVSIRDKSSFQGQLIITPFFIAIAGTFDATDILMRWLGEDPYQYEKAQFLKETFERRAQMREVHSKKNMERALGELPEYLGRVWRYGGWPVELRRRVLFALWDECAEKGNALMRRGGGEARLLIVRFVRENLGADSPLGYQPDEVAYLNSVRSSSQPFAPYGDEVGMEMMVAASAPERERVATSTVQALAPPGMTIDLSMRR